MNGKSKAEIPKVLEKKEGLRFKDDLELLSMILSENPVLRKKVKLFIEKNYSQATKSNVVAKK